MPDANTNDAGQALPPAPVVTALDVKPGDRWVYDVYDDITGDPKSTTSLVLTEVGGHSFNVQVTIKPAELAVPREPTLSAFDDNWNILEEGPWKDHPGDPITGVRLPLKLGARWTTAYEHSRHKPEVRFSVTATSTVAGWERVKLRDGAAYDAFRIETSEHAKAFGGGKVIDVKGVQWFAPKVSRFVKRQGEIRINGKLYSRTIETLVSYSRRGTDE